MASAKSSRSRPAGHSGVFPVGSAAAVGSGGGGGGGGGGGDGGVQLADKLKIFKTDNFDPDAYVQSKCQTMNEKVSPDPPAARSGGASCRGGGEVAFRCLLVRMSIGIGGCDLGERPLVLELRRIAS